MKNSRSIQSEQSKPHLHLSETVLKHINNEYRKPFQKHNLASFEKLQSILIMQSHKPLILDSCCGTGMSTSRIAQQYPNAFVIGIDRSETRLNRENNEFFTPAENSILIQANCEDFWRLCVKNKIIFEKHFILYPNPYPKNEHLKKRWHGHPVFPYLKLLAKQTILRSNWRMYLEEFSLAWEILTSSNVPLISSFNPEAYMTLFERKYVESGQKVYELQTPINNDN